MYDKEGLKKFSHTERKRKGKMTKVKKVSFRVRRIYYEQFVAGTKHHELRALKAYWFKILWPCVPTCYSEHPIVTTAYKDAKPEQVGWLGQPEIAVISCPGQPTLEYEIKSIVIDKPENILDDEHFEQCKNDVQTELCIVTKIGARIK